MYFNKGFFYFIFTEEREMEEDLERLSISSKDNELGNTSIEGFGGFISSLFQLFKEGRVDYK